MGKKAGVVDDGPFHLPHRPLSLGPIIIRAWSLVPDLGECRSSKASAVLPVAGSPPQLYSGRLLAPYSAARLREQHRPCWPVGHRIRDLDQPTDGASGSDRTLSSVAFLLVLPPLPGSPATRPAKDRQVAHESCKPQVEKNMNLSSSVSACSHVTVPTGASGPRKPPLAQRGHCSGTSFTARTRLSPSAKFDS